MPNEKKSFPWKVLLIILACICLIQAVVIFRFMSGSSPDESVFKNVESFSSFLDQQLNLEKHKSQDLFDRYFNDDFFSGTSDPFKEMERLRKQMEQMMDDSIRDRFHHTWKGWFDDRFFGGKSDVDIHMEETDKAYVMTITIPRLKDNQLDVNIDENGIAIDGRFSQTIEKKDANGNIIAKQEVHRSLSKRWPLPAKADYQHANVETQKDQIIITLPKLGS